jgi:hypothetical protein
MDAGAAWDLGAFAVRHVSRTTKNNSLPCVFNKAHDNVFWRTVNNFSILL